MAKAAPLYRIDGGSTAVRKSQLGQWVGLVVGRQSQFGIVWWNCGTKCLKLREGRCGFVLCPICHQGSNPNRRHIQRGQVGQGVAACYYWWTKANLWKHHDHSQSECKVIYQRYAMTYCSFEFKTRGKNIFSLGFSSWDVCEFCVERGYTYISIQTTGSRKTRRRTHVVGRGHLSLISGLMLWRIPKREWSRKARHLLLGTLPNWCCDLKEAYCHTIIDQQLIGNPGFLAPLVVHAQIAAERINHFLCSPLECWIIKGTISREDKVWCYPT